MNAFDKYVPEYPVKLACNAIYGWQLTVHPRKGKDRKACSGGGWDYFYGQKDEKGKPKEPYCVAAVTHAELDIIELADKSELEYAFAHEIAHVLDWRFKIFPLGHCHWDKRGVKKALKFITGVEDKTPDRTPDSPECPEDIK